MAAGGNGGEAEVLQAETLVARAKDSDLIVAERIRVVRELEQVLRMRSRSGSAAVTEKMISLKFIDWAMVDRTVDMLKYFSTGDLQGYASAAELIALGTARGC